MANTILITGGAGFIGGHLADDALAHGDRVVVLDNLSTGKRENVPAGATFYQRDISDAGLDELVADEKIDLVSHHAAQVNVRISIADPTADARTNILATLDLIAACKKAGVRRLLFASSGGTVYGEQKVYPCDEEHALHPTSPYGCAKLAVELYLDAFRVMGDLDPIVFRYANIYGPRQEPKGEAGIVAILAEKLLAGETPRIFDDGEQTRDYVYVGDLVQAHRAALDRLDAGHLQRRHRHRDLGQRALRDGRDPARLDDPPAPRAAGLGRAAPQLASTPDGSSAPSAPRPKTRHRRGPGADPPLLPAGGRRQPQAR